MNAQPCSNSSEKGVQSEKEKPEHGEISTKKSKALFLRGQVSQKLIRIKERLTTFWKKEKKSCDYIWGKIAASCLKIIVLLWIKTEDDFCISCSSDLKKVCLSLKDLC